MAMPHVIDTVQTDTMSYLLAHFNATRLSPLAADFVPGTEEWPVLPAPAEPKPVVCTASVQALQIFLAKPKTREQGHARSLRV